MAYDTKFDKLWFASSNDSSIKHIDVSKNREDPSKEADYELEGLPWITEYHMMKNKRYVVTDNSQGQPQIWSIDHAKLVKTYSAKNFEQVKKMMEQV